MFPIFDTKYLLRLNVVNNAMKKQKQPEISTFRPSILRLTRLHFFYVLAYAVFILEYDAWKIITPHALSERWTVATIMLVVTTLCWYAARNRVSSDSYYKSIAFALISLDIFVAGFSVFSQRGMASRAVALFAIPIIIAALISRTAIFATAALSLAAYSFAAVRYFALNPSEGYKVELYGDLTFYSAIFFILAALLWVVISRSKPTD